MNVAAHAVLGLLSRRPDGASGYELSSFADRSIGWFWPVPRSVLYRHLARLEADGLVSGSDVMQRNAPDKRVYRLTDAGLAELDAWLAQPTVESEPMRNGFLLKLFLAHRLPGAAVHDLIRAQHEALAADRDDLEAMAAVLRTRPESTFGWLAARYGLAQLEATLAFLDEADAAVDDLPVRME